MHKFRSMVQDAEKLSGPVWAQENDPRITRVGSICAGCASTSCPSCGMCSRAR